MKRFFSLFVLAIVSAPFVIISCEKNESNNDSCNVSDPIEELTWLKSMINDLSDYHFIMSADYKGETVFYIPNCNPLASSILIFYNCDGDIIGTGNDISNEISNERLLWKHEASKCNFND